MNDEKLKHIKRLASTLDYNDLYALRRHVTETLNVRASQRNEETHASRKGVNDVKTYGKI